MMHCIKYMYCNVSSMPAMPSFFPLLRPSFHSSLPIHLHPILHTPSSMPPNTPTSSPSSPHHCDALRVGTFNVGRGFLRKLPDICSRTHALSLDVLGLQEIGDPSLLSSSFRDYFLVVAQAHRSKKQASACSSLTTSCHAVEPTSGQLQAASLVWCLN